ncbi:MAG: hypothetical protein PUP90_12870 [Nostoc sp. S4]|nr:hypothetical protein [Nostoc sp. S4]
MANITTLLANLYKPNFWDEALRHLKALRIAIAIRQQSQHLQQHSFFVKVQYRLTLKIIIAE